MSRNPFPHRRIAVFMVTLVPVLWSCLAQGQTGYQLGHGYDLGPFNFAGYSDVVAAIPESGQKSLSLEDLSLFVSGHIAPWLNPFSEAEFTHQNIFRWGKSSLNNGAGSVVLERLYNDADLGGGFTLRFGKMLTPVGEWNEIHAAPLVLATNRPAVTYQNFSEYLTGLNLIFSDPEARFPDVALFWQPDREFSERPTSIAFDEYRQIEGLHVKLPLSLLDQVGVSVERSHDTFGITQTLVGIDFQYTIRRTSFQGEWTYSDLSGAVSALRRRHEGGGYLSVTQSLGEHWSIYGWFETFDRRTAISTADDVLAGVSFRPDPAVVFKLEYLQNIGGAPVNPTGLFASWSVLF